MSQSRPDASFNALLSATEFRAPDVERAVVGAMILSRRAAEQCAALAATAFTDARYRDIWGEARKLFAETGSVDLPTLGLRLMQAGKRDLMLLAAECQREVVTDANVPQHCRALTDLLQRRSLMETIARTAADALNPLTTNADLCERLSEATYQTQADHGERDEIEDRSAVLVELLRQTLEPDTRPVLRTGIAKLDREIGGLRGGELIVIGGRPGSAKTGLGLTFAQNLGLRGKVQHEPDVPGVIFSLEMTRAQIWNRHIAWLTGLDVARFERPDPAWTSADAQKIAEAYDLTQRSGLYIDTWAGYSVDTLIPRMRRLRDKGMMWFVVDYSAKLKVDKGRSREEEIGKIACELKRTAKLLDVPIVMLHQLNRNSEEKSRIGDLYRPRASDLRDSGQVEQEADIILLTHRPSRYGFTHFDAEEREPTDGMGEIIIEKVRNGPTGIARLAFVERCTRWEMPTDIDRDFSHANPF